MPWVKGLERDDGTALGAETVLWIPTKHEDLILMLL